MRIMSFNTQHCKNFIEQKIDYNIMAQVIKDYNPDIVGLNEMRNKGILPGFDNQTEILSQLTGIENYFFAKAIDVGVGKNPYGNGLLSKFKIVKSEVIPVPDPVHKADAPFKYETRCLLKAELENGLTVLVIHMGLNTDEQENAVKVVLQHIKEEKCILMGDFNAIPSSEVLNPIRERLVDTATYFSEDKLSYPSDKPEMKIDYIFVSKDIEIISADIPHIIASDHRPHTAHISI